MILEEWRECRMLLDGCLGFIDVECTTAMVVSYIVVLIDTFVIVCLIVKIPISPG
jgi:hypothetical protein